MAETVIGRKNSSTSTGVNQSTTNPNILGLNEKINTGLTGTGVNLKPLGSQTVLAAPNFITSLTTAQLKQIAPWLKKFGASKTEISTVENVRKTLDAKFSVYVDNAGGSLQKLLQLFQQDYIPTAGTGASTGPKSNGVTQYVTKKDPRLIAQMIDDTLLSTIGSRVVDKDSRKQLENIVKKMIDTGTTTVSKMDKSGKTTVTQTSGYSDEAAKAAIAEQAKVLAPKDYERQQGLSFFDWMQKAESMRGGR